MKRFILTIFTLLLFANIAVEAKENTAKIPSGTIATAITKGDIVALQDYLSRGANPNGSYFGSQFLTYAIINKQNEALDILLENGANPNPAREMSLVYFAVSEKNQYALAKLLKVGADPNKTFMGMTGKDLALTYKDKVFVDIINSYEANPEKFSPENYRGQTYIAKKTSETTNKIATKQINNNGLNSQKTIPTYKIQATYTIEKKDPKLINIVKTKPVSNKVYNTKIANDNLIYQTYKRQLSEEYYNLYIILDKLLRANNLQYQNWRIGILLNPEDINAYAGAGNFIEINSAFYDSFYQNKDALAFVVAHELSHLILGHAQISVENKLRIRELEKQIQSAINEADNQRNLGNLNNALGNGYQALGNSVASLAYTTSVSLMESELKKLYEAQRQLEIQADTEALILMTKAGYKPDNAKEIIEFFSNLPYVATIESTHPSNESRMQNIQENLYLNDIEELKVQGKNAIVKTNVSIIKNSSDKKTLILTKATNCKKEQYIPLTKHQKLINKAYLAYLDNNYTVAQNLFVQAYMLNSNNYIPALYLSYIAEHNFKQNKQKDSLKQAKRWIKKAESLNIYDTNVQKQKEDIKNLYLAIKLEKKQLRQQKKAEKKEAKQIKD